ncbi:hypothetical protein GCM10027169_28250 [Gordonia jinhuaensis]|uniref:Uncharacterized protein n=1 Tax=Gordonia jinhuaensis TaxID=1517702 RepID=A0A916T8Y3_9ACTN|nr:hypothetical protein GCM10011489_25210 [Gordonia jinhuaensis]
MCTSDAKLQRVRLKSYPARITSSSSPEPVTLKFVTGCNSGVWESIPDLEKKVESMSIKFGPVVDMGRARCRGRQQYGYDGHGVDPDSA